MATTLTAIPAEQPATWPRAARRWRRVLLWAALLGLLAVAQTLLVVLTVQVESSRAQDQAENMAAEVAGDVRRDLLRASQQLQAVGWGEPSLSAWRTAAAELLKSRAELRRVEHRSASGVVLDAMDSPYGVPLFAQLPRASLGVEAEFTCAAAGRTREPTFSRSYFVPLARGLGREVVDLCIAITSPGRDTSFLVGSFVLGAMLDSALAQPGRRAQGYEFSFVEGDGTRLARAGAARGAGVYLAERLVDLPGNSLQLRADSTAGRPSLIPNLATALVLGLSLALFGVVLLLARDVRRRAEVESALAEALAFRKAMENSLSTGLRARDLQGAITYVNPAFCAMVGFTAAELLAPPSESPPGSRPASLSASLSAAAGGAAGFSPPYWPPEHAGEYQRRQQTRLQGRMEAHAAASEPETRDAREGFETVFMRKDGERFPVMIYEAPLVDGSGRHTGWMSAVVDISAQRRVEELSRQQQERLQATARLATVGEMASLLSHELNQPLAAIASYASGSINMLDDASGEAEPSLVRQALSRIAEQAERAGRIIKSVHGFVRRREQLHETLSVLSLVDAVLPLVRLQARKSGTRIEVELQPAPAGPGELRVRCDRTMIEQVLINLTRNAIQAMEASTPLAARVLHLRVRQTHERWVTFSVIDAGPGIAADVAERLFTPFFTTRDEGMGLGLSLCRTVVEQHGGALDYSTAAPRAGAAPDAPRGTEFRFTLPTPKPVDAEDAAHAAGPATTPDNAQHSDTAPAHADSATTP